MSDEKNQGEKHSDEQNEVAAEATGVNSPGPADGSASATPAPQPKPASPDPTVIAAAAVPADKSTQRSGSAPIAWLALLLVLFMAVGVFYLFTDMQRREAVLLQRVQGLESVSGQDVTTFDQMRDNLQRKIELEMEGVQASQARAEEDLRRALAAQQQTLETQQRQVSRLESTANEAAGSVKRLVEEQLSNLQRSLREQQQLISDLTVEDRESWQIAEVQYLLRLANQRLIMTGDTESAEALLRSADNILRGLDDADLVKLRSAVAADIAALQAVPKLDIQGLYLRLDALIRQTDALVLFELPNQRVEIEPVTAEDWQTRLSQGYEMAIEKLSEYIVVSRRDVPVEALMDPQYEGLVRQNMRMLLEQAQVAMLSGNELLFRQSLERAEGWVTQFFKADEQAAVAMAEDLRLIRDERVSVELPDLNNSLTALDSAVRARLARNGN
ncbi:uroporphyrinogen-III C-methyltransferase [Congregibacter litoralis]|uniref:Putative enzyme of heme biosynthesis n=1 Tax=Congregibacter litoralis KT71 TaxID=314285 RepID=A4A9F9_9GAMM|nr:uroporphyrinogen-III C-methyltransferase [Congregibacter litoralis]EAQ97126.1 putative enzyme of heme biosynthesis [Congregibacter litoralis KT71]